MGLRRNALGLAAASATEYGLQLAIPIVLVRTLDAATFGHYRFLWLMSGTALAWAPLFMPQALFYFLPRYKERAAQLITNALVYLFLAGVVVALLSSQLNPLLPEMARQLDMESQHMSSVFLGLWVIVALFDVLPTALGAAHVQAKTIAGLAIVRSALVVAAATLAPGLLSITLALICIAVLKFIALIVYIRRGAVLKPIRVDFALLCVQLTYAAPFAIGNALFLMRVQIDQWIVAATVTSATYAVFSIASVLAPVATLIRQPLHNAMMPKLNAAYASGRLGDAAILIGKANGATSLILVPVIGGLFASTHELVSFVYTRGYSGAASVMQVYLIGMLATSLAVGHVLPALNMGRFATQNAGVCCVFSAVVSYVGLEVFGLCGAALGSVSMLYVGELWSGYQVSRVLNVRYGQIIHWPSLRRQLIAVVLAVTPTLAVDRIDIESLPAVIAIKSTIFLLVYISVFLLLGGASDLKAMLGKQSKVVPDAVA
jgi:O-antigen/teichoic acid export membrane protein